MTSTIPPEAEKAFDAAHSAWDTVRKMREVTMAAFMAWQEAPSAENEKTRETYIKCNEAYDIARMLAITATATVCDMAMAHAKAGKNQKEKTSCSTR